MYLEHFGLREAPFRITPHTEFFFAGANRGATLDALIYAITHDEGIVKVSGEVGSGKTMLCRMLLEKLPQNVETAYIANPSLSREEILYAIAEELRVPLTENLTRLPMRALQERLLELHASWRQVVVLIDEAHAMPAETLEAIRLLSNLETNQHKLLHIVLFGQPELDERLAEKDMRQLRERITHHFSLEPLHRKDIGDYLMFRLRAAGYRGPDLFTAEALRRIDRASEGLTRRLNILADKALLAAFAEGTHLIDRQQADAAIRDARFTMMNRRAPPARWRIATFAAAALAIIASAALLFSDAFTKNPEPASAALAAQPEPAPTVSSMPAPPPLTPNQVEAKAATLTERMAASEEWIKTTPGSHFFIQLINTDANNQPLVEAFLAQQENSPSGLDPRQLRVYRSSLSGSDRLGVIYGDFPTRNAANTELTRFAHAIPGNKPYLRTVNKLR